MPLVGKAQSTIRAHHDVVLLLARAKENRGRPPFRSVARSRAHSSADGCFSTIPASPAPHVDPIRFESILRHRDVTATDAPWGVEGSARPPFRSSSRHAGIPSREYSRENGDVEREHVVGERETVRDPQPDTGGVLVLQEREVSVCSRHDNPHTREVQNIAEVIHTSCARRYEELPPPRAMRLHLRAPFRAPSADDHRRCVPRVAPLPSSSPSKRTAQRRFASAEVFLRVAPGSFCACGIPPAAVEVVLGFLPDSMVPLASCMSSFCRRALARRIVNNVVACSPKPSSVTDVRKEHSESNVSSCNPIERSIGYWSAVATYASSTPCEDLPTVTRCAVKVAATILEEDVGVLLDDDMTHVATLLRDAIGRDAVCSRDKLSGAVSPSPSMAAALREYFVREMQPYRSVLPWTETFDVVDNTAAEFLRTVALMIEM